MSGQHVNDLASSFVEMAKAFEELPRVKAELTEANRALGHATDTIQRLELKLIDRNTTIDELHAKVREAEVARDDEELRFLEADDKLNRVAVALQTAGETVGLALRRPESVIAEVKPDQSSMYELVREQNMRGERPLDVSTTSEKPSSEPLTDHQEPEQSSLQSQVEVPPTESMSLQVEGGEHPLDGASASDSTSHTASAHGSIAPEPFSPESSPTDPVEVREEVGPTADVTSQPATVNPITESPYANDNLVEHGTSNAGQSDPLPTAASPIDALPAGSTNANPSGDASSPIDDPSYANEPKDRWTQDWLQWASRMDAKHGMYKWPERPTAQA